MSVDHVAVAIPAFNEGEVLPEFLPEIDVALSTVAERVTIVVADDRSTDDSLAVLQDLRSTLSADLIVVGADVNRGHGPTARAAYDRCLDTGASMVLHVDGDGQFLGADLRRILVLLEDGAPSVCGVRRFRQDPWFRMAMTRVLRGYVRVAFGAPTRDANCPLRGYRADVLLELLAAVPRDALVPNLYLTIVAARAGVTAVEVDVAHRVRRGTSPHGTMWGRRRALPIPWRLARFAARAFGESMHFRRTLDARRPPVRERGGERWSRS